MTPRKAIVEATNLRKTYVSGEVKVEAVRGIDLRIDRGEFVAVMGPSGSGKSTLLQLLGGMDAPTSGKLSIEGADLSQMSDDERTLLRRRRIGFIFQSYNLLPTLTAQQNVALPLELDGVPSPEAEKRAASMLAMVGLAGRLEFLPSRLSGGEQQRVAIARALTIQPSVILADEPTGNLDSANVGEILRLLRRLADDEAHTIVLVTHDSEVASRADRLIRLRDGLIESDEAVVRHDTPILTAVEQGT